MADRFHLNCDLEPGLVVVHGPEAHHMSAVCRVRPGDAVVLFNGNGQEYHGRVVEVTRRDVSVEITSVQAPQRELPCPVHLAAPLPKGDRATFLVEKLTELGVTCLHLLLTERTVVQPRDAKVEKLQRVVIEASKQCGRNLLMRVEAPRPWEAFVQDTTLPARRLLAHPGGSALTAAPEPVVAVVGPEGGFTEAELALAQASGWQPVGLGARILRVETAALALAVRLGG